MRENRQCNICQEVESDSYYKYFNKIICNRCMEKDSLSSILNDKNTIRVGNENEVTCL